MERLNSETIEYFRDIAKDKICGAFGYASVTGLMDFAAHYFYSTGYEEIGIAIGVISAVPLVFACKNIRSALHLNKIANNLEKKLNESSKDGK